MKWTFKKYRDWNAIIRLFFIFFGCLLFLGSIVVNNIIDWQSLFDVSWIIIPFVIFCLFIVNLILWQFFGYEDVELNGEVFIIHKKGKLINNKFKIPTLKIYSITTQDFEPIKLGSHIFRNPFRFSAEIGEVGGKILIKYGRNGKFKTDFGSGLTEKEAKLYVQEMNDFLELTNNNNNTANLNNSKVNHENKF